MTLCYILSILGTLFLSLLRRTSEPVPLSSSEHFCPRRVTVMKVMPIRLLMITRVLVIKLMAITTLTTYINASAARTLRHERIKQQQRGTTVNGESYVDDCESVSGSRHDLMGGVFGPSNLCCSNGTGARYAGRSGQAIAVSQVFMGISHLCVTLNDC